MLEISERGVVRSTTVALPKGASIGTLLPSNEKKLNVVAGHFETVPMRSSTSSGSGSEASIFKDDEIEVIDPNDGSVLRRIKFAQGLMAVCEQDETYTFVSPRDEDGKLQIVRGTVVH